jgi:hypothetical protein
MSHRPVPLSETTAHLHIEGDPGLREEMEAVYAEEAQCHRPVILDQAVPEVEEMNAPELIQAYYEAGYELSSIVAVIATGDLSRLRHTGLALDETVAPINYEGGAKHDPDCPCEACVSYLTTPQPKRPSPMQNAERAPAPPSPTPGLGRPETTRKEARWERAITWLLSRGDR